MVKFVNNDLGLDNALDLMDRQNLLLSAVAKFMGIDLASCTARSREESFETVKGKHIVYLDTNAWKCLSDFERGKDNLTDEMVLFSQVMANSKMNEVCVFPIGLGTLFELMAMSDPQTRSSVSAIVDNYSKNVCVRFYLDIIREEMRLLEEKRGTEPDPRRHSFCRPFELLGPSGVKVADQFGSAHAGSVDQSALCKLLLSQTVSEFFKEPHDKGGVWNNKAGIEEMNCGKVKHQSDIATHAHGVLIELVGLVSPLLMKSSSGDNMRSVKNYAINLMYHWHTYPNTRHMITARVMASLHGLIRATSNRHFKSGDIADFAAATAALPVCDAFFTDRRLYNIVNDPQSRLGVFSNCKIVCGFDGFYNYLKSIVESA